MSEQQQQRRRAAILFVAAEADERYDLAAILDENDYEVHCRSTGTAAYQLLSVTPIDLVIADVQLLEGPGAPFVQALSMDDRYDLPVMMIGEEDDDGTSTRDAFEAGAEDFIECPFIEGALLARVQQVLKRAGRDTSTTSMNVKVSSDEVPGILQFMAVEMKTGRLQVRSESETAQIWLSEGRLVQAQAPNCEGREAIIEVLSWPTVLLTFHEELLHSKDIKMNESVDSVIMNSVVEVDEFREARDQLPTDDALILPGDESLPEDAPENKRKIYDLALNGFSVGELVQGHMSRVRATLIFRELVEEKVLQVLPTAFENYASTCKGFYQNRHHLEARLGATQLHLRNINFPLPPIDHNARSSPTDWLRPVPRLLVAGDRDENVTAYLQTIQDLFTAAFRRRPPTHSEREGMSILRLEFDDHQAIDLQQLPAGIDLSARRLLDELLLEVCGIIFFVTHQDADTLRNCMRLIRQLRRRFLGVFTFVVPRVPKPGTEDDDEPRYVFKISCVHCGYRLAVDMEEAGYTGTCPVCQNDLLIPDPLDNLAETLKLPDDVPILMVDPAETYEARDLLLMQLDSMLMYCRPERSTTTSQLIIKPTDAGDRPAASQVEDAARASTTSQLIIKPIKRD